MVANVDGERLETVTTELKMNLVCAGGSTRLVQTVQVLLIIAQLLASRTVLLKLSWTISESPRL